MQTFFISTAPFWAIGLGCLGIGFGWVLIWGPSISSALSSIPHHLAGTASGMFTTLQEVGAVVSLAIAGVFFRTTHTRIITPEIDQIDSALRNFSPDQVDSLMTNPVAMEQYVGKSSSLLPLLREGFLGGYQDAFWFLLGSSIFAFLLSLCLPKKTPVS